MDTTCAWDTDVIPLLALVGAQMLGSSFPPHNEATPMPKTKALMADLGATATNFFIHTPICCPSRSELLSGRYFHNIKQVGGGCMHVNESKVNGDTFARSVSLPPFQRARTTPPLPLQYLLANDDDEQCAQVVHAFLCARARTLLVRSLDCCSVC